MDIHDKFFCKRTYKKVLFSHKKPLITILDSCSTSETKNLKEDGGKKPLQRKNDDN